MKYDKKHDDTGIYEVIRQTVGLQEYCENQCGLSFVRYRGSYRANSPFNGAGGSFCINVDAPEFWLDFAATDDNNAYRQGDVVDICALLNHNGDKKQALLELLEYLPETERKKYSAELTRYMRERDEEQAKIQRSHDALMSGQFTTCAHWIPYLLSRGLDEEQIRRLKIGFDLNDCRLLIPRFNFDGVEVLGHNRRRMPNAEGTENEQEAKYKYAQCNSFVKKVPAGLQTLSRKGKHLVLTEGDFGYMSFEREGFAVLGVLSGKDWQIVLSNAENFDCIVLAYDNDDKGREYTQNAAQTLLQHNLPFCVVELPAGFNDVNDYYVANLEKHDTCLQGLIDNAIDGLQYMAKSFIPEGGLDSLKRSEQKALKNRLKDFLIHTARSGCDRADITDLCTKLSAYYPSDWLNEVLKLAEKEEPEFVVVENLCKQYELRYNSKTGFYKYDNAKGIWIPMDDKFVGTLVRAYLGYSASAKRINNITEHLKSAVFSNEPIDKFDRLPLFAFANGTWHYNAKEGELFRPASSADYVTHRVTYSYDAAAECPTWKQAVSTVFAGDEKRIACFQEFCGYTFLNHCKYQKALILRDTSKRGSNGKSTLLEVLRAVFGEDSCTSLEPCEFENIHSIIQLKDTRINICTDIKAESKAGDANLKKAITGDTLRGRFLHKDFIEFKSTAKIIFAVNGFLAMDISGSMQRRLLVIDCPVRFVDTPQEGNAYEVKADPDMKEKLMKELAGIFNWCVTGARRLIHNGGKFTVTEEQAEFDNMFKENNARNDIDDFAAEFGLTETVDVDGNGQIFTRAEVYAQYLLYCEVQGIEEPVSRKSFHGIFRQALSAKGFQFRERKNSSGIVCYDFS